MKKRCLFLRTTAGAAALALSLIGASAVHAEVDMDYTGPLDSITGEGVYAEDESSTVEGDQVQLEENLIYDRTQAAFVYSVNGAQVVSSVMDGMIVQGEVSIVPDESLETTLYCDGEILTDVDLSRISETGNYVLEAAVAGQSEQILSFSLVGAASGTIDRYTMPSGFTVTSVTLDGAEIGWDHGYVDLNTEGKYVIDYTCERAGIFYELDLQIDHTAPELTIEGVDEDNLARGPVTLRNVEEGAAVTIQHNGDWGNYQQTLTQSGEYCVHIEDEAGNSTDYYFTILIYLNSSSFIFFALVLAVIAAVIGYVMLSRKRLRVR